MSQQDQQVYGRKRSDFKNAVKKWHSLERATGVSEGTRHWIMQSTDPFHDSPLEAAGYPSGVNDRIVVHEVTKSISVTKPPDLASGNWDLHITMNNVAGLTTSDNVDGFDPAYNQPARAGAPGVGQLYDSVSNSLQTRALLTPVPYVAASIMMHRVPTGTGTFGGSSAAAALPTTANLCLGALDIPPQYLKGPHRIVGVAFEVINTTEMLNRNGSVTVYRVPSRVTENTMDVRQSFPTATPVINPDGSAAGALTSGWASTNPTSTWGSIFPPQSASQASLSHGSQTWSASEGCYCIGVFEKEPVLDNQKALLPYMYSADTNPAVSAGHYGHGAGIVVNTPGAAPSHVAIAEGLIDATTITGAPTVKYNLLPQTPGFSKIPVMRTGAYFVGLSNSSSLRVTARWFVERVPPLSEPDIYTLAQPSPPYAPEVWELYTKVAEEMPPGVMFTENPLGEWFNKVAGLVAKYAPTIGDAVGTVVPGASAIGHTVGTIAKAVKVANKAAAGNPKAQAKVVKVMHAVNLKKK